MPGKRYAPESGRGWSPPWIWEIACPSTGPSTAIPSRTPPVEPGRFTIRVRPATPATPRERIADGTPDAAPGGPRPHPRPGTLGGEAAGGYPGPAGGHDDVVAARQRGPQRRLDRLAVGHDPPPVHGTAGRPQQLGQYGPRTVRVYAPRGPVRSGDDQ